MAERYAEWSGGKSFFVHDYHFNYFQVGVESLGESFFDKDGIASVLRLPARGSLTPEPR